MENQKKKWGDRKDGVWIKDLDGMHAITPYLYYNRADNEAFISEEIELTSINEFVEKKNRELREKVEAGILPETALEDPYKLFQVLLSAFVKTVTLRPKMNRFIQGRRTYQRNELTVAFVVKKKFRDNGGEALAFKPFGPDTTIDTVHELIVKEINELRDETKVDNSTAMMDVFAKIPRFILRPAFAIIHKLDFFGKMPYSLIKTDPDYASIFVTNLGSIQLRSGYHHLNNWGTNSLFIILGEKKMKPFFDADGNVTMREVMNVGLTVDERIADGYYFSKTIKMLKYLLKNPELLETRADEPVEVPRDFKG